jgi:pimeloyl-ACP methyl ester carboxylesterase
MTHIEQTSAIEIMETRISFSELGKGEPVLLLHGNPGSRKDFSKIAEMLDGDKFRCIYPDRPGHMSSDEIIYDKPDPWLETALYADLIDKKADGKAVIVGYSLGCFTAAKIALKFPEKVKALVFIAPYLIPDKPEKPSSIPELAKGAFLGTILGVMLPILSQNKMQDHLERVFAPEDTDKSFVDTWLPRYTRFENLIAMMSDKNSMLSILDEVHEKLEQIRCPVRVVIGKNDSICSNEKQLELLKQKFPELQVIEVEGAGHALPFTQTGKCCEAIDGLC